MNNWPKWQPITMRLPEIPVPFAKPISDPPCPRMFSKRSEE